MAQPVPKPAAPNARRRRPWVRIVSLSSLALSLLFALIVFLKVRARPDWYRPVAVDSARLAADKRDLTNLLAGISDALNHDKSVEVALDEAQLNRWIAARDEMPFPYEWVDRLPDLQSPQVELLDGNRIRISTQSNRNGTSYVVSLMVQCDVQGDQLRFTPLDVRIGTLSLPRFLLEIATSKLRKQRPDATPIDLSRPLEAPAGAVWPNGKRPFFIRQIETSAGHIRLQLNPR